MEKEVVKMEQIIMVNGGVIDKEKNVVIFSGAEIDGLLSGDIEVDADNFDALMKQKQESILAKIVLDDGLYYEVFTQHYVRDYCFEYFLMELENNGFIELEKIYNSRIADKVFAVYESDIEGHTSFDWDDEINDINWD